MELRKNIQLFAETPEAPASEGGEGAGQAPVNAPAVKTRRAANNPLADVVYGKGDDEAEATAAPAAPDTPNKSGVSTTSDTLEERRKAFEALIGGEYKDLYQERMDMAMNRSRGMERTLSEHQPIIDMLMQRYHITGGDLGKLRAAMEADDTYLSEAAEAAGMTVEQYRSIEAMRRENEALRQANARYEGKQRAEQQLAAWARESEEVKALYPTFDFNAETGNRDFMGLLRAGIGVKMAYELVHMEDIKAATAKAAGQQMTARIQSRSARPAENGTSTKSAVVVKSDVHSLTKADRAEIARRVQRGEKIRF